VGRGGEDVAAVEKTWYGVEMCLCLVSCTVDGFSLFGGFSMGRKFPGRRERVTLTRKKFQSRHSCKTEPL